MVRWWEGARRLSCDDAGRRSYTPIVQLRECEGRVSWYRPSGRRLLFPMEPRIARNVSSDKHCWEYYPCCFRATLGRVPNFCAAQCRRSNHSKGVGFGRTTDRASQGFQSEIRREPPPPPPPPRDLILRWRGGEGPFPRKEINVGVEMIDKWKVITSRAGYDHAGNPDKDGQRRVLSTIDILPPGTICTETYLIAGVYETRNEAYNLIAYMKTRFFRFLVSQFMYSHDLTRSTAMGLCPVLNMPDQWTRPEAIETI